ncbi:hypothetical protein AB0M28_31385 [Streptomyces sp. NPDC051940]|uniref:hypothetical protein n=1 Tax=Streptomyces sp. NPDC051940 TaxID=3155675 RepID=UPI003448ABE7
MRKASAFVAAVVAVAVPVLAGAPAATATTTAYPTTLFGVYYDNSEYFGHITWYNRSVTVSGGLTADGCRRVYGIAWAGTTPLDERSSSTHCNEEYTIQTLTLDADVPGGADHVRINLTDAYGNILDYGYYYRP